MKTYYPISINYDAGTYVDMIECQGSTLPVERYVKEETVLKLVDAFEQLLEAYQRKVGHPDYYCWKASEVLDQIVMEE